MRGGNRVLSVHKHQQLAPALDFVSDQLFDGRRFRALTLVDNYSRECLEIEVGQNLKGMDVVAVMERIKASRSVIPKRIQVDNGSEFISTVSIDRILAFGYTH